MYRAFSLSAVAALLLSQGCASTPTSPRATDRASALLRDADSEIARGCYLCFESAARISQMARTAGAPGSIAVQKEAEALLLMAAREREVGIKVSDALDRAKTLIATLANSKPATPTFEFLDASSRLVAVLPLRGEGFSTEAVEQTSRRLREAIGGGAIGWPIWFQSISQRADDPSDMTAKYLLDTFDCLTSWRRDDEQPASASVAASVRPDLPLFAFRQATCSDRDALRSKDRLARVHAEEPRFFEAAFFLGRAALSERRLVTAESEFLKAANGLPRAASAWVMLGVARLALEDADIAAEDFRRALSLEPGQRQALLSLARALNEVGRYEEAAGPARKLIDLGVWFQSDANYLLAFAEFHLDRLRDADGHAREAKRTNSSNGDTARLVGLIAHRLGEFDRAQSEFELAVSRNELDCESRLHLGMIHATRERWRDSVDAFVKTRDCYGRVSEFYAGRLRETNAAELSASRKSAMIARLTRRIEDAGHASATASLGAAESEFQSARYENAATHLGDAAKDPTLAPKVADLRRRLDAKPSGPSRR